jgi:hypothetical protein
MMNSPHSHWKELQSTVDAVERVILDSEDDEILLEAPFHSDATAEVRALITKRLTSQGVSLRPQSKELRRSGTPSDLAGRLALLREIATRRPDVATQLAAVFGAKMAPTSADIDRLVDDLIQPNAFPKAPPKGASE